MFSGEHVKEIQFERNVQIYEICYHVPFYLELSIYAACSTFMTLEGKTRLTIYFSPLKHVLCFSACRLLLQNARLWVVYKPHYLSLF